MLLRIGSLILFVVVACLMLLLVCGWPMDETGLIGCTPDEVRERYGEPMLIQDHRKQIPGLNEFRWTYRRGWMGESAVEFQNGVVVRVSYRPGHD